jgi:hypothetical protein
MGSQDIVIIYRFLIPQFGDSLLVLLLRHWLISMTGIGFGGVKLKRNFRWEK